MVSPYSLDVPGGVQLHVLDLAQWLIDHGHDVSVLAPADDATLVPDFVVSAGKAVPVKYNGSVARLVFGPVSATRVSRWLDQGSFDVVHIHEPASPSVSLMALWSVRSPVVATFHTSTHRSRAMYAAHGILKPGLEKITARVSVSEEARRTVMSHWGLDSVVIPNGVYVDRFADAVPAPAWQGTEAAPTLAFLGRVEEPRKGLGVLLDALPAILARQPGARLLVAGPGDVSGLLSGRPQQVRGAVTVLGPVSDAEKAALLSSVDVYVAPNTGGESFGIILIEAMSAGAAVLASDIEAFRKVLDDGAAGVLFKNEDPGDLARAAVELLADTDRRAHVAHAGSLQAMRYDWSVVGSSLLEIYGAATGLGGDFPPRLAMPATQSVLGRVLRLGGRS